MKALEGMVDTPIETWPALMAFAEYQHSAQSQTDLPSQQPTSRWKWRLQMKYTVIQEEERVDVNITRNADKFGCQFDSKELDIQLIAQNGNEWIVDLGQGPERMVVAQVGDRTERYLRRSTGRGQCL